MGKPSPPKPPDYAAAATAQGQANLNSALGTNYLNQANQITPQGSLMYSYDQAGGQRLPDGTVIPQTTVTTTLSPEQQRLYDQNTSLSSALNDLAGRGLQFVGNATENPLLAELFGPKPQIGEAGEINRFGGPVYRMGENNFGQPVPTNIPGQPNLQNFSYGQAVPGLTRPGAVGDVTSGLNVPGYQTGLASAGAIPGAPAPNAPVTSGGLSYNADINNTGVDLTTTKDFQGSHNTLFESIMARQNPWLMKDQEALDTKLAVQGITQGGRAYNDAQLLEGQKRADARLGAEQAAFQQKIAEQMANLSARKQGSDEQFGQSYLQNAATGQAFQQDFASSGQDFGQRLAAAQYGQGAQGQQFSQNLAGGQFANNAIGQGFNDQLAALGLRLQGQGLDSSNAIAFNNQLLGQQGQGYNQALGTAGFNRDSSLAGFNTGLAAFNAGLGQQQQGFNQSLAQSGFNNQARQDQFAMNQSANTFTNQAQAQAFAQAMAQYNAEQAGRSQAIQEANFFQNQPLNLLNSLRTGNQVQSPQFGNWSAGSTIAPPPIYSAAQDQYAAEMANYNARMQASGGFMGGLASLGGAALMSPWLGGK